MEEEHAAIEKAERVLDVARRRLPQAVDADDGAPLLFFVSAACHAANLLTDEIALLKDGRFWNTRMFGRGITEAWLWGNAFILDGDTAVDRFLSEDSHHQRKLASGWDEVTDRLAELQPLDLDPPERSSFDGAEVRPNIRDLARRVRKLRDNVGIAGGIAEIEYEVFFRRESVAAVHTTTDLLFRYLEPSATGRTIHLRAGATSDDVSVEWAFELLVGDARKLADLVALYERAHGSTSIEEVFADLGVFLLWKI